VKVKEMFMRMLHETLSDLCKDVKWKKCLWECYIKEIQSERNVYDHVTWIIEWYVLRCEGERNVYENVTWRKYKVKEMFMRMLHETLSDMY
jgi:hypothetical protein